MVHDDIVVPPNKRPRVYRLDFPPHLDAVPHPVPVASGLPLTGDEEYLAGTHRQMVECPPGFENFEELVERLGHFFMNVILVENVREGLKKIKEKNIS